MTFRDQNSQKGNRKNGENYERKKLKNYCNIKII